jgi:hypothetical protein
MRAQFDAFDPNEVLSNPGVRTDLFHRDLSKTRLTDFFGGVSNVDSVSVNPAKGASTASSVPIPAMERITASSSESPSASSMPKDVDSLLRPKSSAGAGALVATAFLAVQAATYIAASGNPLSRRIGRSAKGVPSG